MQVVRLFCFGSLQTTCSGKFRGNPMKPAMRIRTTAAELLHPGNANLEYIAETLTACMHNGLIAPVERYNASLAAALNQPPQILE